MYTRDREKEREREEVCCGRESKSNDRLNNDAMQQPATDYDPACIQTS